MTFTLPDGSTLSATLTTTITSSANTQVKLVAAPSWAEAALGAGTYLGISGKPVIYALTGKPVATQLSAISLVDPSGKTASSVVMAGADGESTDYGDGANAYVQWTSTGTGPAEFELMLSTAGLTTPVCTVSGLGTATVTCMGAGSDPVASWILSSTVTPAQTFGVATSSNSWQGHAFAVLVSELTAAEAINGRSSAGDQFTVKTVRSGASTTLATATTSGTATTATTTALGAFPTDTYTMTDAAAAASTTNMSNYVSSYACTNAVSSSTSLPSGTGTTLSVTPAGDDQITCTFTNDALTLSNAASSEQYVTAPATITDTFTLTNSSVIPATFTIGSVGISGSSTGSISASGYVFNGNVYTTLAAAQSAITAAGTTAANGSITVGVQYSAPATAQTISTTLSATDSSTGSTSTPVSATATDATGWGLRWSRAARPRRHPAGSWRGRFSPPTPDHRPATTRSFPIPSPAA
jgi:hypothetical protein